MNELLLELSEQFSTGMLDNLYNHKLNKLLQSLALEEVDHRIPLNVKLIKSIFVEHVVQNKRFISISAIQNVPWLFYNYILCVYQEILE